MNKIYLLFLITIFCTSCGEDNPILLPIKAIIITDLHAPTTSNPGEPPSGNYVKFSFKEQKPVEGDNWDIAFRATDILINGGAYIGNNEPPRTGIAAGYVAIGTYNSITSVDETLLNQDSQIGRAIPNGSDNGWYNYNPQNYLITPIAGRTLVFKTHDGRFAKMEIQSYYKDSPENPNAFTDQSATYTFNYTYQPNESVTTF